MQDYINKHYNDLMNVASLIHFRDGISLKEAQMIIKELENKGLIQSHTTREYQAAFGCPVWYIP